MFAIARIAGWSAHRIEELANNGKIIRPAYKYVGTHREYQPIDERQIMSQNVILKDAKRVIKEK